MSDKNDLLRRQDCIEAIEGITCSMSLCVNADECHGMKRMQRQAVLEIANMPAAQPDHTADVSEKVDMMHEYIYKIVKDCDGVNCYIKQGKIIRCKDCKHKHVENMVWTCPFGLPGGENFFCGYGAEPYKGE